MTQVTRTTPSINTTQTTASEIDLHPLGVIRERALIKILPFGIITLLTWSKDGRFPAPVKNTNNITAWCNQDVIDWLNSQTSASSTTDEAEV